MSKTLPIFSGKYKSTALAFPYTSFVLTSLPACYIAEQSTEKLFYLLNNKFSILSIM